MTDLKSILTGAMMHREIAANGTARECRVALDYSTKDVQAVVDYARSLEEKLGVDHTDHTDYCVGFNLGGDVHVCLCSLTREQAKSVKRIQLKGKVVMDGRTALGTLVDSQGMVIAIGDQVVQWGTDAWGSIETEPDRQHARKVSRAKDVKLFNRIAPDGQWHEVLV